jgi:hypothetical protein
MHTYRIDHDHSQTHSWYVTIQRRGRIYHRHFTDSVYALEKKRGGNYHGRYWLAQWPISNGKAKRKSFLFSDTANVEPFTGHYGRDKRR